MASRHLDDLKSIRFAPVPLAILLMAVISPFSPPVSRTVAWTLVGLFLLGAAGFYLWSNATLKRLYRSSSRSR